METVFIETKDKHAEKENSSDCLSFVDSRFKKDKEWDSMTVVSECFFSDGVFRMIFRRQFEWQPATAGGGGACGERRSLWGQREQQGTGVHSCQRAFPETSPWASGATTLLQLPPGDLSPSANPWKSLWWQVTLAAGGAVSISTGSNLETDESDCRCYRCCRGCVAVTEKWQSEWQPLHMLLLRMFLKATVARCYC